MKLKDKVSSVTTGMSRKFHMTGLKLKKHSPEILIVTGVVGVVASTVMACKATTKVSEILDEARETIDDIHEMEQIAQENDKYADQYTAEDVKRDLTIVYAKTGVKLAKLYAPSVILGVLSLTAIVSSNKILRKRNVALAAAYAGVEKSFKEYRGRVVERFGKEIDNELRYNIKAQEIEEKVTNEDGSETTVKKTVNALDPNSLDNTAKLWYEGNAGWKKDPEANLIYLKAQQAYANDKLKLQGYLFVNDVYDQLHIPRTKEGQVLGWIYDEENPIGDNFVDFGLYNQPDFINGYERSVLLTFNHDGNILDKI